VVRARDRAASPRLGILGGGVNNLKTTFRDAIAVENALVRAEADPAIAWRADSALSRQTESDSRHLTPHARCLHLGVS
jgi:hypothetical protein